MVINHLLTGMILQATPSVKYARQIEFIFPNFRGEKSKKMFENYHHLGFDFLW